MRWPHVQNVFHWFPSFSPVSASIHPHVDIAGQVPGGVVSDIVDSYQRSSISGDHSGDPVRVNAIIPGFSQRYAYTERKTSLAINFTPADRSSLHITAFGNQTFHNEPYFQIGVRIFS